MTEFIVFRQSCEYIFTVNINKRDINLIDIAIRLQIANHKRTTASHSLHCFSANVMSRHGLAHLWIPFDLHLLNCGFSSEIYIGILVRI